ncbi:MAG: phosphoribosylanthranilate isomerase [Actinomycetota bacterium]
MITSSRTFIKICGITRVRDVRAAVCSGVSAVGFVFARSPRRVSPARALELRSRVHPSVRAFGVFVDAELPLVLEVVDQVGLDGVQLQGSESPDFVAELKRLRPAATVFKVIRTNRPGDLSAIGDYAADGFFVDSKDPARPLQRTEAVPIQWLRELQVPQLVVAGGLNPANVSELVRTVRPWGVDVSAGVEASPGKKDPALISSFVRAVREAEA